jgi:ribosomal protein S18 acetylase RimI-like enzyme
MTDSFGRKIPVSDVTFRPAAKADCRVIAGLYSISSDGVAEYIWSRLAQPGEDLLDVGQRRYEQEDSVFSYRSCTLAERGGEVVGMLVAFPMHVEPSAAGDSTDPVLAPYRMLEDDNSYYVCGMAVLPEYRNCGIGTGFLQIAESHALQRGYGKLSLVVFEQNRGALRLYERTGYVEVARAAIVPHPLIRLTGDALLMVKSLVA